MPEVELGGEYKGLEAKKGFIWCERWRCRKYIKRNATKKCKIKTKEDEEEVENGNIAVIDF